MMAGCGGERPTSVRERRLGQRAGRAEDLDVVPSGGLGQRGRLGDALLGDLGDEPLEAGRRADYEPASGRVAYPVGVRHPAWRAEVVAARTSTCSPGMYSVASPSRR